MSATTLKFNLKDTTGTDRFMSPMVKIETTGNEPVIMSGSTALQFGYLVKSYCEESYSDKTLLKAGFMTRQALEDVAGDDTATVTILMPTLYADRESSDIGKWTPVAIVKASDLLPVAVVLEAGYNFFIAQEESYKTLPKNTLNVVQPVYFTPEAKPGEAVNKPGKKNQPIRLTFGK